MLVLEKGNIFVKLIGPRDVFRIVTYAEVVASLFGLEKELRISSHYIYL